MTKKLEFFQKWLIGCAVITFFFCVLSYIWALLGVESVENIATTLIQTLLTTDAVSVGGYAVLNGVRAYSADKYGYIDTNKEDSEEEPEITLCERKKK